MLPAHYRANRWMHHAWSLSRKLLTHETRTSYLEHQIHGEVRCRCFWSGNTIEHPRCGYNRPTCVGSTGSTASAPSTSRGSAAAPDPSTVMFCTALYVSSVVLYMKCTGWCTKLMAAPRGRPGRGRGGHRLGAPLRLVRTVAMGRKVIKRRYQFQCAQRYIRL